MAMKKVIWILASLILISAASASVSRLYIGELDGQFMAGVDTRIDFGPFFAGADVRTVIKKTIFEEDDKVVGFMPDRTDYKTLCGIDFGDVELEYAHTCYHRVISNNDLSFYKDNINPPDTDTIGLRIIF